MSNVSSYITLCCCDNRSIFFSRLRTTNIEITATIFLKKEYMYITNSKIKYRTRLFIPLLHII